MTTTIEKKGSSKAMIEAQLIGLSLLATMFFVMWGNLIAAGLGGIISGILFSFWTMRTAIGGLIANAVALTFMWWIHSDLTVFCWFVGYFFIACLVLARSGKAS